MHNNNFHLIINVSYVTGKMLLISTASTFQFTALYKPVTDYMNNYSSAMARDNATLASFSIIVQHYSQNHKIAFLGHPTGASGTI